MVATHSQTILAPVLALAPLAPAADTFVDAAGRFNGAGQVVASDASGRAVLRVDLTMMPEPNALPPALSGQSRTSPSWHRDTVAGQATSNVDSAEIVPFQRCDPVM